MNTFNLKNILLVVLIFLGPRLFGQPQQLRPAISNQIASLQDKLHSIDTMILNEIKSGHIKNAVGFISLNGNIVYDKAFGELENGEPVPENEIYRIASQTKAITSVAIMMLYDEGKIKLDDEVSKFIPAFKHPRILDKYKTGDTVYTTVPADREITIKDLLTHTSGLDYPEIGSSFLTGLYAKSKIPAFSSSEAILSDKINELAKYPLMFQPGKAFNYSYSLDVLGAVVEKISGISLKEFFYEKIFSPLEMNDTYFYLPRNKFNRLIPMYTIVGANHHLEKWKSGMSMIDMDYPKTAGTFYSGGAGLVSTIKDYAIFLQMLLNGGIYNGLRILKETTVKLMTTNQVGDMNIGYLGSNKWGLGFMVITSKGSAEFHLEEGCYTWGGAFGSFYWVDPKNKLVALIYLNQSAFDQIQIREKFKILVNEFIIK